MAPCLQQPAVYHRPSLRKSSCCHLWQARCAQGVLLPPVADMLLLPAGGNAVLPPAAGMLSPPDAGGIGLFKHTCPEASFAVLRCNGHGVNNSWTKLRSTSFNCQAVGAPPLDGVNRVAEKDGNRANENHNVFEGVPNTRNMRSNMSNSLVPGNATFPAKISTTMHPNDHISTAVPYRAVASNISGARYHNVVTFLVIDAARGRLHPKSAILTMWSWPLWSCNNIFAGFKSRCRIWRSCMYSKPQHNCLMMGMPSPILRLRFNTMRRSKSQCSKIKSKAKGVCTACNNLTTLGCWSCRHICTSLASRSDMSSCGFSMATCFTTTSCPPASVFPFFHKAGKTSPNVPAPSTGPNTRYPRSTPGFNSKPGPPGPPGIAEADAAEL